MDNPALESNALAARLFEAIVRVKRKPWISVGGMSLSCVQTLLYVQKREEQSPEGPTVSAIRERLGVTSPTTTQWLNHLAEAGLVERHLDPEDRRRTHVQLTPSGQQRCQKVRAAAAAALVGLVEYMGQRDAAALAELLTKAGDYFVSLPATPAEGERSCGAF